MISSVRLVIPSGYSIGNDENKNIVSVDKRPLNLPTHKRPS